MVLPQGTAGSQRATPVARERAPTGFIRPVAQEHDPEREGGIGAESGASPDHEPPPTAGPHTAEARENRQVSSGKVKVHHDLVQRAAELEAGGR